MAISVYGIKPYYVDNVSALYRNDTFEVLSKMTPESIDLIFADPPYFLSNGGISCSGGKAVKVDKGEWDKVSTLQEKHQFNRKWISLCKRVLKPDGTIWISGTMHNIYSVGMALEEEGFKIINNIITIFLNICLFFFLGFSTFSPLFIFGLNSSLLLCDSSSFIL